MHIVLVCREYIGSSRAGGIASYLQEISNAYIKLGHRVTVVTASEDTRKREVEKINDSLTIFRVDGGDFLNSSIEKNSFTNRFRFFYRFKSYRRKVYKIISSIKDADVVEVADYGAEGLYLDKLNIPVVLRLHTPMSLDIATLNKTKLHIKNFPFFQSYKAERRIYRKAKYISSCSSALLEWVKKNLDISPRLVSVVNNPINVMENIPQHEYNDSLTIFYGGTICDTKGVGDLVAACLILREKNINVNLKLAGKGGSYYEALKVKAETKHWNWISFLGKLNRNEMYQHYASAAICCFPSWWENMPMVCLEAMSVGAIVIASSSGGAKEIISDSVNGFIVDRKNPEMLADCIEKVLQMDKASLEKISMNARNRIKNDFNPQFIASKLLSFYSDAIKDFKSLNN